MNRAYVDANVIVRFVTGDPPELADKAARLFALVDGGDLELVVESAVVAESVWVLSSYYGFSRDDIASTLLQFLVHEGIVGEEKTELLQALALYREKNIDYIDALLAVKMGKSGVREIYSFDRHFDRIESVARLDPE